MYSIDVDEMNVQSMLLINILAVNRQIPVYLLFFAVALVQVKRLGGTFMSDNIKEFRKRYWEVNHAGGVI